VICNVPAALIADEWAGIHPTFEAFYIHSIIYSASRAGDAFQRFDIARAVGDTEENQVSAVHEALGHTAAWACRDAGKKVTKPYLIINVLVKN